jgi:hypothetical protein
MQDQPERRRRSRPGGPAAHRQRHQRIFEKGQHLGHDRPAVDFQCHRRRGAAVYSNGSVDIDVQLFNQGSETNSQSLFERFYPTSPELISQKNPVVVVEHSLSNGYQILYTKQNILLRISTTEKSDFALNMAKQFYWNIDKKIVSGD